MKRENPVNKAPHSIQKRNPDRDLLLVVDVQNVYLPGNPWACPGILPAIDNTVKLLRSPDLPETILTRFVPPSHPRGRWKAYNKETAQINKDAFLCQLVKPILSVSEGKTVVEKSTYSALKCPQVRSALTGKRALVLAGVVAECCVLATMMDAIDLGYEVIYLYDCIAGQSAEMAQFVKALAERFSPVHTQVMSSEEYLSALLL
jgi:nicotinamidase-related amidase